MSVIVKKAWADVPGIEPGWLYASATDYATLLQAVHDSCAWAKALGCPRLMSASDRGSGDNDVARARMREMLKPVYDKYTRTLGEDVVRQTLAELEKHRASVK